jgi:phenylacetate-CoA ligase
MLKYFKKKIAANLGYPLQDYVNGTHKLKTQNFLLDSQYWSKDRLQEYQLYKFKKLLDHAVKTVPFYKNLYKDAGLGPGDIKTLDDIQKLPIVTKKLAREFNQQMVSDNPGKGKILRGVTGGTTGPPLKLLRDHGDLSFTWGAFYRWYNWMGIEVGDPYTKIWGTPTVLHISNLFKLREKLKNFYYNRQFINSFNINEITIENIFGNLNKFQPKFIRGYLSALIQIAEYMEQNNIKLNFQPKAISSTTETLLPPFKKIIEDKFGAKLYDQYGCGECNSIAFDAGDDRGLYITEEHCYIEILNHNDQKIVNQDGRLVLTNLDNFAMPFIRYENGDFASYSINNNKEGIKLGLLKRIAGRATDTIILKDNSKVHGVFFTDILNELFQQNPKEIHRFQVFQDTPKEIEFRIESKTGLNTLYVEKIKTALYKFFNHVEITHYQDLPLDKSGKFRYIISGLKNDK